MTPASSVSSAGGKLQRVENTDASPLLADDETMECVASKTFEGEGQLSNSDPVSISQMSQWDEWFNAHFQAAILEHQNLNQRFQEMLMLKIQHSNEEFRRTIG